MLFFVSFADLINIFFIAAGVGICGLTLMQVTTSTHMKKNIRRYFQVFFILVIVYITMHLARQLMNGRDGSIIRKALYTVTFFEFAASGFMACVITMLMFALVEPERYAKSFKILLIGVLALHILLLALSQINGLFYYFDKDNVYHRSRAYIVSNLCPAVMMLMGMAILVKCRDRFAKRVRLAFWIYLLAPIAAMAIQSFSAKIQYIIFATVGAAVYMFSVIVRNQNEEYEKQKEETSRIETELTLAASIQANMLPNIFPAYPEREEFDIYASMTPAKEVGGDFYDFFFIDDDHLGIVMADVSGKGIPAALFMMISKSLVQNAAITGKSAHEVLETVNNQLCANNPEEMFVTVWFGILEISTGKLQYANAGHEHPAYKAANGDFELIMDKHGLVCGAMADVPYRQKELIMEPGAKLFLYTDGVAEATNSSNELFGTDRMIEALKKAEGGTPEEILAGVNKAVDGFVKEAPQFDDLTMLCLHYRTRSN